MERLEQVFEMLGKPARGKICEAIQVILSEGEKLSKTSRVRRLLTPD